MIRLPSLALFAAALALSGCDGKAPGASSPLAVSAIGSGATPGDPSAGPLDPARRVTLDSTAQGLVRFDASGQIEPGLAERWIVLPDGRSYIFRLREATWPDGSPVTTEQVVRVLKRAAAPNSRNPLAPFLQVIDEIVAMTDTVIEVRLKRPRPDLLKLFAQPEMAVFEPRDLGGSGPYRIEPDLSGATMLIPALDPAQADGDTPQKPDPAKFIRFRGERAALAIARFKRGKIDLVLGGSFADWPILAAAQVPQDAIRIDPAAGLFGLVLLNRQGFLADPANRAAIAMAIDRGAITSAFAPDWNPVEALLPARLDSAAAPALPDWSALSPDARRDNTRAQALLWRRTHGGRPPVVRIALPPGPGATRVWIALARSLAAAGIQPVRVTLGEPADLRLIDMVAPYDSARWFLATACMACSDDVAALIAAARDAPTLDERARLIAEADTALAADSAYIPIAQPLRWAIVTNRITGWQGNTRAWHPLSHLRNDGE
jgi:peptide/nickel transport system substrate-binding protein